MELDKENLNENFLRARQMSWDLSSPTHIPLKARIAEFRQEPELMDQMTEFVDDIINKAEIEVNKQLDAKNKVGHQKDFLKFSTRDCGRQIDRMIKGSCIEKCIRYKSI